MATLNKAIDLGVNLIDTAEAYGPFENEMLISKVLKDRRGEVIIASKFATDFDIVPSTGKPDGSAEHVRRAVSLFLFNKETSGLQAGYFPFFAVVMACIIPLHP